jgi:protein TonB
VLVQFVVDTTGRAEVSSLRFLAYSDRGFARAVYDALPQLRFEPAELGGRKVRQLVQQPFTFTIEGDATWECKPGNKP